MPAPDVGAPITENTSENTPRRRGRPPVFGPRVLGVVERNRPGVHSRRGKVDIGYRLRALAILHEDDPACRWLTGDPKATDARAMKGVILTELGRIDDEDALRALARQLCATQPPTAVAVRALRRWRGVARAPRKERLAHQISATISYHMRDYPQTTWEEVYGALECARAWTSYLQEQQERAAEEVPPR